MKVKFFSKITSPRLSFLSKPLEGLECGMGDEINQWLTENQNISIKEIKQTMSGGSWTPAKLIVSIWYVENNHKVGGAEQWEPL